ncbi:cell division protein ZapA [Atopobacter sp. AH10]|uniref:cell division protein ZapA n=1 Tax=Atopobacter sp. AH10 TaxID=2315861 RepID=UPI000EF19881|nr:cell division protein ZapA [Atopobacter sp. AH10]RLK63957.1 cell division protein ZapA [Atopobacter sp. AH10]
MASTHRTKMDIDGRDYTISSHHSQEHMKAVEALLNQDLQTISRSCPKLAFEDKVLLLAINTLSQLVEKQKLEEANRLHQEEQAQLLQQLKRELVEVKESLALAHQKLQMFNPVDPSGVKQLLSAASVAEVRSKKISSSEHKRDAVSSSFMKQAGYEVNRIEGSQQGKGLV